MGDPKSYPYATHLNVLHPPLDVVNVQALVDACNPHGREFGHRSDGGSGRVAPRSTGGQRYSILICPQVVDLTSVAAPSMEIAEVVYVKSPAFAVLSLSHAVPAA